MFSLKLDKSIKKEKIYIRTKTGIKIPAIVLMSKNRKQDELSPGVLWIHGGGYFVGMKEMVYMSRAINLVKNFNAVVISPGYRLAPLHPYPAAINDCYDSLLYMLENADKYHINKDQIMVGGESAGGGLAIALTYMARDKKEVNIAYQMPLYPMMDNLDTLSSKDNHGKVWNTKRNHFGWKMYLRKDAKKEDLEPYASPARQKDYSYLPPAYTFVGNEEPFYEETRIYIENLKNAGIEASMDVYPSNMHAFDMLKPSLDISKEAIKKFDEHFSYAKDHYFAKNK
ncbi:MAG: alpha/beta hydrolase [Bacilli bacterium]